MGEYYNYYPITIPVGQQQHYLCFAVVVLVVRQEWGNIGVGPHAGAAGADAIVRVQVGTLLEGAGKDSERGEGLQTSFPELAHLMNYC